ncbi:MAG: hypothetical protein BWY46_00986 [Firmicutes bacterium ADurb.Bin300]|nr:MAG: hypothetical protein BWY46_00986 [Firmicutes bacterium ADurb.Bin300]
MISRNYEKPYLCIVPFALEDIITVSVPVTTEEETGVELSSGGGEITVPFSDFFN